MSALVTRSEEPDLLWMVMEDLRASRTVAPAARARLRAVSSQRAVSDADMELRRMIYRIWVEWCGSGRRLRVKAAVGWWRLSEVTLPGTESRSGFATTPGNIEVQIVYAV